MILTLLALILSFAGSWSIIAYHQIYVEPTAQSLFLMTAGSLWCPGIVALTFAHFEKIRLPVFADVGAAFPIAMGKGFLLTFLIAFANMPFGDYLTLDALRPIAPEAIRALEGIQYKASVIGYFMMICALTVITMKMLTFLGGELMWRGYLFEKVKHLGLLPASLLIGLLWGIWNAPFVILIGSIYPGDRWIGAIAVIPICLALSPLLCAQRFRGHPIIVPTVLYATLYLSSKLALKLFDGANPLYLGLHGLTGFLILIVVSFISVRLAVRSH